jgi:alkane 1-monooxygenase
MPIPPRRAALVFGAATLAPGIMIALGVVAGSNWALTALAAITVLVGLLDRLSAEAAPEVPGAEFPAAGGLSVALGLLHLGLVPLVLWGVAGPSGLGGWERAALFLAAGLYLGQVGHANAHELIHRSGRWPFRLGAAVYAVVGFGHHVSAHRLVHHRFVATPEDPNSARAGQGFWAWAPRAWAGSFRAGWRAEDALRARARAGRRGLHPYAVWIASAAAAAVAALLALGPAGLAAWAGLAAHVHTQVLLSDYVQHWGLRRRTGPDGKAEPVGPAHAWEAPQAASGAMLLLAGRHAEHHMRPTRAFPALAHRAGAPRLPYGLPVMGVIALVPPLWRRVMGPRLAAHRRGLHAAAGAAGTASGTVAAASEESPMRAAAPIAALAVVLAAAPALAEAPAAEPLSGAAFDALTRGRTLTYAIGDTVYGVEQYLTGRRVIWAFLGEPCRYGFWTETAPGTICFVYDHDPAPQCWQFFDDAGRLRARFMGDPPGADDIAVGESAGPMQCPGPVPGV